MPGSSGQRSRLAKLALLLGSSVLALVGAELVVRQFVENPITGIERTRPGWKAHRFVPDAYLEYVFEPGFEGRMVLPDVYDVPFRINAQGIRDDRVYAPQHPGVFRILLVGDSFVFGTGVVLEETLGRQLEQLLNADPGWGRETEVVAIGCPGYELDAYAKLLDRWVPQLLPDLIVVGVFPGNDVTDYELKARNPRTVIGGYIVNQRDAWSYELRKFSTLAHMVLKSLNPHPASTRPETGTREQDLRIHATVRPWIRRILRGPGPSGAPLVIAILEGRAQVMLWQRAGLEPGARPDPPRYLAFDLLLRDFRDGGAEVIDPSPAWMAAGPAGDYYHPRDVHYNAAGNRLVASYLARELRARFSDRLPR